MTKMPQQIQVVQVSQSQSQEIRCELCGCDHSNGHCAYQNNSFKEKDFYMENQGRQGERRNQNQSFKQGTFQQHQPLYPSFQERISKLEEIIQKFTQTTLAHQKNFENLETQLGQIAQRLKKSREKCKSVTTRSGMVVGKGISNNLIAEKERKFEERDMKSEEDRKHEERKVESEKEKEEKKERKRSEEETEKNERVQEEKKKEKNENRKKSVPVLDLPYPHSSSRKNIKKIVYQIL